MTKTFVVIFKGSELIVKTYTSLSAIYADNTNESLGVSLSTLQKRNFVDEIYENEKVRIELCVTRTKNEIIRLKEQFL